MGTTASVTWTDGALSGDPTAVKRVRALTYLRDGSLIGLTDWWHTRTEAKHLASPYSWRRLMLLIFDGRPTQEGALPKLPDPPPGAVR